MGYEYSRTLAREGWTVVRLPEAPQNLALIAAYTIAEVIHDPGRLMCHHARAGDNPSVAGARLHAIVRFDAVLGYRTADDLAHNPLQVLRFFWSMIV